MNQQVKKNMNQQVKKNNIVTSNSDAIPIKQPETPKPVIPNTKPTTPINTNPIPPPAISKINNKNNILNNAGNKKGVPPAKKSL